MQMSIIEFKRNPVTLPEMDLILMTMIIIITIIMMLVHKG